MQGRRMALFLIVVALIVKCVSSVPTTMDASNRGSLKSLKGTNHSQVLIVGAGASGITAAARLLEHGVDDVIILEAEDRIGGRINSVPFGDDVVDLGAQWVHGGKGNVVYDMAKPLGLIKEGSPAPIDNSLYFKANGTKVDAIHMDHFGNITCAIMYYHDALSNYSGSLGEFFHDKFNKTSIPKNNITVDHSMIPLYLSWIEKVLAYESGADSWFNISAKGLPQFWEIPGYQTNLFKTNGFSSVIDLLTKRYPNPSEELPLRTKTNIRREVQTIHWGSNGGIGPTGKKAVIVETSDGARYTADFVIVTVSLGVLKENAETMFNPPLTGKKMNAIQHLGFGIVEQLFFQFNETWWPTNISGISVLSTEEDRGIFNRLYPKLLEKGEWTNGLTGLYLLPLHPRSVLFNWLAGEHAQNMEKYSDEDVITGVQRWFEMFLNQSVPSPVSFVRSKWCNNPHFRGSFSHRTINSEEYNAWPSHLAEPLFGKDGSPEVLFAGEATSSHHYSTVHGAIETGRRAADRVLDFLRKNKNLPKASNKI